MHQKFEMRCRCHDERKRCFVSFALPLQCTRERLRDQFGIILRFSQSYALTTAAKIELSISVDFLSKITKFTEQRHQA